MWCCCHDQLLCRAGVLLQQSQDYGRSIKSRAGLSCLPQDTVTCPPLWCCTFLFKYYLNCFQILLWNFGYGSIYELRTPIVYYILESSNTVIRPKQISVLCFLAWSVLAWSVLTWSVLAIIILLTIYSNTICGYFLIVADQICYCSHFLIILTAI